MLDEDELHVPSTARLSTELATAQLVNFVQLSAQSRQAFLALNWNEIKTEKSENIVFVGDRRSAVYILLEGWAYRYKLDVHGNRQIVGLISVGETVNLDTFVHNEAEYGVGTLTPARFAATSFEGFYAMARTHLGIMEAIVSRTLIDNAVLAEWAFRLGSKSGCQRVAHLLCEIASKIPPRNGILQHPLTQVQMAEILGLSHIHVNRIFRQLRADGLVSMSKGAVEMSNYALLAEIGGFDSAYLGISVSANTEHPNNLSSMNWT